MRDEKGIPDDASSIGKGPMARRSKFIRDRKRQHSWRRENRGNGMNSQAGSLAGHIESLVLLS